MKNKADLDSIYWVDLLKSQKISDLLLHSGELWELVVPKNIASTLQKRLFALISKGLDFLRPCCLTTVGLT